jgi:hypothetical protein
MTLISSIMVEARMQKTLGSIPSPAKKKKSEKMEAFI